MSARSLLLCLALFTFAGDVWAAEGGTQEEAVDLDALDEPGDPPPKKMVTRVPEHDYDRRLIAFPLLLVAILAWNVKWKSDAPVKKVAPPAPSKAPVPGPEKLETKEGSQ